MGKIFKKWYQVSQGLDAMGRQRSERRGERAGKILGVSKYEGEYQAVVSSWALG